MHGDQTESVTKDYCCWVVLWKGENQLLGLVVPILRKNKKQKKRKLEEEEMLLLPVT